jgi:malonyl-CoA/methylmalonyl-CoA synthetase
LNANLYAWLAARFAHALDSVCIEADDTRLYRYADLEARTAQVANLLVALGVRPGDRVAAQVDKTPEALFLYLGCLRAGCVYLPLNTAYQEGEIEYFLGDAQPALAVCRPEARSWFEPLASKARVAQLLELDARGEGSLAQQAAQQAPRFATLERSSGDLASIVYTSGTTGRSKGAMLTHGNIASNAEALHACWGFEPGDVLLHALPFFHVHGLFIALHPALANASRILFHARFDPAAVIRDLPRATVFMGVPTMYVRLLAEAGFTRERCAAMRLFVSGSAPLLVETFRAFEQRTGQRILERYGMSETGINTSNPCGGERRGGTVGAALPGVEVRVVDESDRPLAAGSVGAIQVRGPNVMPGYWRMPERNKDEFTRDGFFRTGDLGTLDSQGYLSIVGRSKDLVISGGYNVYPKEVEMLLDEYPGVEESAVIGLPHPDFGEQVVAVVVGKKNAALRGDELIAHLRSRLAGYKVPKRVHLVSDLPRNAMGKVQKNLLRERFAKN